VRNVRTPLGLLTLLLLLLYLFLVAAGTMFGLSEGFRELLVVIGVIGFVALGGAAIWLIVKHPTNLVFGEETQFRYQQMLFGTNERVLPPGALEALPPTRQPEDIGDPPALTEGDR
jgi:hypothetical protein